MRELQKHLKVGLAIEEYATSYEAALLGSCPNRELVPQGQRVDEVIISLYARFSGIPLDEIRRRVDEDHVIYKKRWGEVVSDEDSITPQMLGEFYNSLPFPVGSSMVPIYQNRLAMAFRYLPVSIIESSSDIKRVYDFGGNAGDTLAVIANTCDLDAAVLIGGNKDVMEFAGWRDRILGLKLLALKTESEICEQLHRYEGSFDFGLSSEVLEHVWGVEEAVSLLSRLLRPGGLLLISTSFGLYPYPSHLKKNLVYAGKEVELLKRHKLYPVPFDSPIPLLGTMGLYRKEG